jgi:hypothetical protein
MKITNYTNIEQIFHNLIFKFKIINNFLFEIEKLIFKSKKEYSTNEHIFITGLPRSGTTILLNLLYSSGEFASLKYSNMPFLLSPNLSKIFFYNNLKTKKRIHGDGISFNLESPEAFDEVFFLNYIDKTSDLKLEFKNYVNLIISSQRKERYISKNNSNYKRINFLKTLFKKSHFLLPVRDPIQHAISLYNQHLNFINLQKKNSFIKKYMNFLGHNEFGDDHKYWNKPKKYHNPLNFNYWLEQWYLFYSKIYLKHSNDKNCNFLVYEKFTESNYLKNKLSNINIKKVNYKILKKVYLKKIQFKPDDELIKKSSRIYDLIKKNN